MSKLHYTEKFYSLQGESVYMGVPSVFLRMFGCNFRCKNFGRYEQDILGKGHTHNPEVIKIINNIDQYGTFQDLPLVSTGCDSYSSIYPEFKKFVIKETAEELAAGIVDLLPFKEWKDEHLVITGGEPLLGWQRAYPDLLEQPSMHSLKELTFETNGTQELSPVFAEYLKKWQRGNMERKLTFNVSPKLPCSGELWEDAICPEIVRSYQDIGANVYLKFVIATEQDAADAERAVEQYRNAGFTGHIYLMPLGGTTETYQLNTRTVAELAMSKGWRYSARLQCDIFKNAWGT